ncbi:hypothetical protein BHE74_00054100 [Ensete ventricosum]|nr:hypothetical protein BHE74_00054100 [Ensete ventricosum]
MDRIENARRFGELIDALDEERRKVEAFHRELPLCLHLINQSKRSASAIQSYKQLMVSTETLSHELAVKEFIPLTPRSVHPQKPIAIKPKKSWGDAQYLYKEEEVAPSESLACQDAEIASGGEGNGDGGMKKKKKKKKKEEEEEEEEEEDRSQPGRKVKRYWSEELHKRFLHALEQLGGCHGGFMAAS